MLDVSDHLWRRVNKAKDALAEFVEPALASPKVCPSRITYPAATMVAVTDCGLPSLTVKYLKSLSTPNDD
jgi:hypothetical protein